MTSAEGLELRRRVAHLLRRYRDRPEFDDLVSEACLEALQRWAKAGSEQWWRAQLPRMVRWAACHYYRRVLGRREGDRDGCRVALIHALPLADRETEAMVREIEQRGALEPEELVLRQFEADRLWGQVRAALSPFEAWLLWQWVGEGRTLRELAVMLDHSESTIHLWLKPILARLREAFGVTEVGPWRLQGTNAPRVKKGLGKREHAACRSTADSR